VIRKELQVNGIRYLQFTGNVLSLIQIFGHPIRKYFLLKDIVKLVKKVEKQVILKGLIAQ
jgi:hypothetical protein